MEGSSRLHRDHRQAPAVDGEDQPRQLLDSLAERLAATGDVDPAVARRLVDRHEQSLPEPWSVDDAPDGYIAGQAKGIVGLELVIGRIDAKRKLTQNRSEADIRGAIDGLRAGNPREQAVAEDMAEAEAARSDR